MIETLKYEDLGQYKELIDACFGNSNSLEEYQKGYKNPNGYEIIVSKGAGAITGSITYLKVDLFTFDFQPCIMIFNVSVLPEFRGQKIGKGLVEYIINYAKEHGYKSISLTCLNDAYDAQRLYESMGFKKTDSIKYNLDL